jgi:transketolase
MPAAGVNEKTVLKDKATLLRIHSIRATSAAGSGHPTSSASAAEIMSVLFFSVMRYDPKHPQNANNDVFILSKGHAAPILYAAWAEAGAFPIEDLTKLRTFGSDLEGHPTPRLPFVPVATGSLGQGLSAGVGTALAARLDKSDRRVHVLLGDGESAEGSVWEAAQVASHYQLDHLCTTIDINRFGQSDTTMDGHNLDTFRRRWEAFGWNAVPVDGHDIDALLAAYSQASSTRNRPTVVLARTIKGKGIGPTEDRLGFHGKPVEKEEAEPAIETLRKSLNGTGGDWQPNLPQHRAAAGARAEDREAVQSIPWSPESKPEATRKAFGVALAAIGKGNERIVVLDGDVKNSTYTEEFEKACSDRFFQMYIAEQNMVGTAMGMAAAGRIPFAATFACFLTRAYDFMRMAAISGSNIKLVGSHAGVSIGEDGPSQMGLEDLAMACAQPNYTVLYPSDAVSAWRATELAAATPGPFYIRTSRPKSPVIYNAHEQFEIGKAKVLRRGDADRAAIIAAGVTLHEALKAHEELQKKGIGVSVIDLFSVQPIDAGTLAECARSAGGTVITVEDHYAHGGIGDAVASALSAKDVRVHKLAVGAIPRSGQPQELLEHFGISARAIADKVLSIIGA